MILVRIVIMWAGLAAVILAVLTGCYAIGRGWVNALSDTPAIRWQIGALIVLSAAQYPLLSGVIFGDAQAGFLSALGCAVVSAASVTLCFRLVAPPRLRRA